MDPMSDLTMDDLLTIRLDRASDGRRATNPDLSGRDLDLCGDGIERPRVLIPERDGIEPCPLKVGGDCPAGCDVCVAFAEEMHHRGTDDTEDTEK